MGEAESVTRSGPQRRSRASGPFSLVAASFAALCLLGGPSTAQPVVSTPKEESGAKSDWAKRCNDNGKCIIQTGLVDDKGELVAMMALTKHPTDGLVGELRTPVGLHIPSGLLAIVDDGKYEFKPTLITCLPQTCLSAFRATDEVIDALKKGGKLNVNFIEVRSGKKIGLSFSLIGFTAQLKEFQAS